MAAIKKRTNAVRTRTIVGLTTADGGQHRVVQERHPSDTYGVRFMTLFLEAAARASMEVNSLTALRVLLHLPSHLSFTEFRRLPRALQEEVGTDQPGISRAMTSLHKLGIVEREGRGPVTTWRMSSDLGWGGTPSQWHAFRAGRLRGKKPPQTLPQPVPEQSPRQSRLRLLET